MLSSDSFHAYRRSATLRSGRERVHSAHLAELLHQHPSMYHRWQAIRERSISTQRLLVGDWTAKGVNQDWERDVAEGVAILNRAYGQATSIAEPVCAWAWSRQKEAYDRAFVEFVDGLARESAQRSNAQSVSTPPVS